MTTELELITTDAPELIKAVSTASLEPTTGERLILGFAPFFRDAKAILDTSRTITVADATQVTEIKASRDNRLKLRAVRIAADKTRKTLKEDSQNLGNAIQSIYNLLALDIEKEEKRLQDAEDFAERAEAERKEKLKRERTAALVNADALADLTGYDLGAMSDASFANLLESTKMVIAARKAAAEKAESERKERERLAAEELAHKEAERKAELAAAQRIAAAAEENARLVREEAARIAKEARAAAEAAAAEAARIAAEVAEREAAAAAERKRIEDEAAAKLAAERAESERLRKEAAEASATELARVEAAAKAEREAAAAEAKRVADEARAEQLKRDAEIIAQRAAEKAERDRLQAIKDAAAAEERRLAKAESDRLVEEARLARVEAARLARIDADRVAAELEAKRQADIAARKAAQSPDKEKLIALADAVVATAMPAVSTPEAQAIVEEFQSMLQRARAWIIKKTEAM